MIEIILMMAIVIIAFFVLRLAGRSVRRWLVKKGFIGAVVSDVPMGEYVSNLNEEEEEQLF